MWIFSIPKEEKFKWLEDDINWNNADCWNKEIILLLLEQRKMLIEKLADNNKTYLQEEIRELDKLINPYFMNWKIPRAIYKA